MVESEILSPQQPPQAYTVVPVCNLLRQLSDISSCVLYDNNMISHVASYMITSAQKRFPPVIVCKGLTDGGVIVFERQESDRKWGTSPPAENGAGPSSITAGATSTTDQAQRPLESGRDNVKRIFKDMS
ncbi:topless-related protein 4-like protein isoform X1, partial [Tanacetum coccineum]